MPERIQRRRTKGWRMPEGAVYVGRTGGYSEWANPFRIGDWFVMGDPGYRGAFRMSYLHSLIGERPGYTLIESAEHSVEWYRRYADGWNPEFRARCVRELRGHDLVCWCPITRPDGSRCPCHADVLLEIANG